MNSEPQSVAGCLSDGGPRKRWDGGFRSDAVDTRSRANSRKARGVQVHSWTLRPGTSAKCRTLWVTTVAPSETA